MERTRINKKVSAILTSDWHLREDTPVCYTGDFQQEQWIVVQFIKELQEQHECPVLHAGDLFHHWKPSPWLLRETMKHLPKLFYTIYGQHDLPQHNINLSNKCGIDVLEEAGKLTVLDQKNFSVSKYIIIYGLHWNELIAKVSNTTPSVLLEKNDKMVLVWHHLTYLQKPFPGASGGMAEGILRKYPQFDLIVTGDNHTSFTIEYQGRRLVNPGNITRQVADQIDFQPKVYLWCAEDNSVKAINLPIQEGVISREHIDIKEQRDKRIQAFVKQLDGNWQAETSFEANLEAFFQSNNVREPIKQLIYKAIET